MDASILDHNFTVVAYIAKAIMDDTISDKRRELQVSALRKLIGQLNYYEERGFSEMLLCAIAEKKGKLILETTTKLEMDRVVSPRAPYFNGNRFTPDKYSIPEEELIATSKIIRLYKLWADSENCVLNNVDYMARAEKISEISDTDENFILYRLSEQVKQLEKKRGIIKRIKKTLASELKGMCRAMDSAEKFYYSLGGKKISVKNTVRLGKIIRLAGDEPFALNGLSVMREEGLLEPL